MSTLLDPKQLALSVHLVPRSTTNVSQAFAHHADIKTLAHHVTSSFTHSPPSWGPGSWSAQHDLRNQRILFAIVMVWHK